MSSHDINQKYLEIITNILEKQNKQLLKSIAIREHLNPVTLEKIFLKSMKNSVNAYINDHYH